MKQITRDRISKQLYNILMFLIWSFLGWAVVVGADLFINQFDFQAQYISWEMLLLFSGVVFFIGICDGMFIQRFIGLYDLNRALKAIDNPKLAAMTIIAILAIVKGSGWEKPVWKLVEIYLKE